jgi:peptidoglycan/xylan/chitin deacetylase (PgdA/CDA1 family)
MIEKLKGTLLRLTKLFISMGFYVCSGVGNLISSLMGKKAPGTCVAVHYHEVAPQHRKRFARQMDTLMRHAKPLAADYRQPLQPGQHHAVVTIDDGLLSSIENAIPELVRRRIPVAFFVLPGLLGTVPRWAEFGTDSIGQEIIATADRLRELPRDLITIGSHTLTHPLLPSLSEDEAKFQLFASRAELEKLLNREITLFSFPYGEFSEPLIQLCREAGYQRVFTVLPIPAFTDPREFVTGRIAVNPTDWGLEFRLKILGAYRWLPAVFAWKRKLLGSPYEQHPKVSESKIHTRTA